MRSNAGRRTHGISAAAREEEEEGEAVVEAPAGQGAGEAELGAGGRCGFHWFSPEEACALLSSPPTTLIFLGDRCVCVSVVVGGGGGQRQG